MIPNSKDSRNFSASLSNNDTLSQWNVFFKELVHPIKIFVSVAHNVLHCNVNILPGFLGVSSVEWRELVTVEDSGLGFVRAVSGWWDWGVAPAVWAASESTDELSAKKGKIIVCLFFCFFLTLQVISAYSTLFAGLLCRCGNILLSFCISALHHTNRFTTCSMLL